MPLFGRKRQKLFEFSRQENAKIAAVLSSVDFPPGQTVSEWQGGVVGTEEELAVSEAWFWMDRAWRDDQTEPLYGLMSASYSMLTAAYQHAFETLADAMVIHPDDSRLKYGLATAYAKIAGPADDANRSASELGMFQRERDYIRSAIAARTRLGLTQREALEKADYLFAEVLASDLDAQERDIVQTNRAVVEAAMKSLD